MDDERFYFVPLTQDEAVQVHDAVASVVPRPREWQPHGQATQRLPSSQDSGRLSFLLTGMDSNAPGFTPRLSTELAAWFASNLDLAAKPELAERFRSGLVPAIWKTDKRRPGGGYWRPASH